MTIFHTMGEESIKFLRENGFCHIRINDNDFKESIKKNFNYYNSDNIKGQTAFKNKEGVPRHIINILRDPSSPIKKTLLSKYIIELIDKIYQKKTVKFFTHSKLSLKKRGQFANWYLHQDNGYRNEKRAHERESLAICLPLESMDETNGTIEVYPGSNKLGPLKHETIIENRKLMETQRHIHESMINIKPFAINAEVGDIILFSGNTFHRSGSNSTESKRLCVIVEVEVFKKLYLDDYGLVPIFVDKKPAIFEIILLYIMSIFSIYRYWFLIRQSDILRKMILNIKYLTK